jgi:GNAT superfamily N-acetyltransferase
MKQKNRPVDHTTEVRIRNARASDLPALRALYEQLRLGDYNYRPASGGEIAAVFRAIACDRNHHLIVAMYGNQVVGTLHLSIFRHLGHGLHPLAVVENVVVVDAMRSRGIGERLVDEAGRIAERNRCYKMSLTTHLKRPRAHRFYQRLGWNKTHFGYSFELKPGNAKKSRID